MAYSELFLDDRTMQRLKKTGIKLQRLSSEIQNNDVVRRTVLWHNGVGYVTVRLMSEAALRAKLGLEIQVFRG